MDPVNERRIFNLVVSLVSQPNSSQYFILTPKVLRIVLMHMAYSSLLSLQLLKNLNYSSSVKVHIIGNGAEMNPFHQWRFSKFIHTASSMYEEEEKEIIVIP